MNLKRETPTTLFQVYSQADYLNSSSSQRSQSMRGTMLEFNKELNHLKAENKKL